MDLVLVSMLRLCRCLLRWQARLGVGVIGCTTTGEIKKVVTTWKAKGQAETQAYAGGLAEHLPDVEDEEMRCEDLLAYVSINRRTDGK